MPVLDHPVHEAVREKPGAKYGCFNREHASFYIAPTRIYPDGGPYYVEKTAIINNVMTKSCRYDMSMSDTKCDGCNHRGEGEEWSLEIRSRGS